MAMRDLFKPHAGTLGTPRHGMWTPADYYVTALYLKSEGKPPSEHWLRVNAPTFYPMSQWPRMTRLYVERTNASEARRRLARMDVNADVRRVLTALADEFIEADEPCLSIEPLLLKLESRWNAMGDAVDDLVPALRGLRTFVDSEPLPEKQGPVDRQEVQGHIATLRRVWQSHMFPETLGEFCRDLAAEVDLEGKKLTYLAGAFERLGLWKNHALAMELGWDFQRSLSGLIHVSMRTVAWAIDLTRAHTDPFRFVAHGLHPVWKRSSYGLHAALELFSIGEFEAVTDAILHGLSTMGELDEWPYDVLDAAGGVVALVDAGEEPGRQLMRAASGEVEIPRWLENLVSTAFVDYLWSSERLSPTSIRQLARPGAERAKAFDSMMFGAICHRATKFERAGFAALMRHWNSLAGSNIAYRDPADRVADDWKRVSGLEGSWSKRLPGGLTDEVMAVGRLLGSVLWSDDDVRREEQTLFDDPPYLAASVAMGRMTLRRAAETMPRLKYQLGRLDDEQYYLLGETIRTAAPLAFPAALKAPGEPVSGIDDELWRALVTETATIRDLFYPPGI